jgi:hypothetical protein
MGNAQKFMKPFACIHWLHEDEIFQGNAISL